MTDLRVTVGAQTRDVLCRALDSAKISVEAEFYSIRDNAVEHSISSALQRGVHVCLHVEGYPHRYNGRASRPPASNNTKAERCAQNIARKLKEEFPGARVDAEHDLDHLLHGKALVVDGHRALIATGNINHSGFADPGEVCVEDDDAADIALIARAIDGDGKAHGSLPTGMHRFRDRVVAGPEPATRNRLSSMLNSRHDCSIAMEDLSDEKIVDRLIARANESSHPHHDRVLLNYEVKPSNWATDHLDQLVRGHVDVRFLGGTHMHEKYIDTGDRIFVGSHNLTRNGLDEAREIGILARASDYGEGARWLRENFDGMWSEASNSWPRGVRTAWQG